MSKNLLRSEDGVALITGILVSAIVLVLSISAVAISIHNTDASGYDKRRLIAVGAAEAGIDFYYARLGSTSFASLATAALPSGYSVVASNCQITGTTTTTPSGRFVVTPTFYATSATNPYPTAYTCSQYASLLAANPTGPWYVELRSAGTAAGQSTPERIIRSRARLSLGRSGLVFPAAAMLGNLSVGLSANVRIDTATGSNNGDVYSEGNVNVTTQTTIKGNMYVQGSAYIANGNFQVTGDVWAKNAVTIGGGVVGRDVISSTSTIALSGNTRVYRNAKAGSTITVQNPATVYGTRSPATSGIGDPPRQTYPTYTFTAGDWPGYVTATTCADAIAAINSWSSGNLYIRLTASGNCSLAVTSPKNMPGNLAVITNGGLTLPTPVKLQNGDSATHSVYFFTGLTGSPAAVDTSANCASGGNFVVQSNANLGTNLKTVVFTPRSCSVTINSNGFTATGQIFSGSINYNSNSTLTYAPVTLPEESAAQAAGYLVDIVYKRETAS